MSSDRTDEHVIATDKGKRGCRVVQLVALTVIGGYFLTAAGVALAAVLLHGWGVPRSEATIAAAMAGLAMYPALLLWGLSRQRLKNLWLVFGLLPVAANAGMAAFL